MLVGGIVIMRRLSIYWPDHRLAIIVAWTSSCVRVRVCVCVCVRATSTL